MLVAQELSWSFDFTTAVPPRCTRFRSAAPAAADGCDGEEAAEDEEEEEEDDVAEACSCGVGVVLPLLKVGVV